MYTNSADILTVSANSLAFIFQSVKTLLWIFSTVYGLVTGCPFCGSSVSPSQFIFNSAIQQLNYYIQWRIVPQHEIQPLFYIVCI